MREPENQSANREVELIDGSIADHDEEFQSCILNSLILRIGGTRNREELKRISHSAALQVHAYLLTRTKANPKNRVSDKEAEKALQEAMEGFETMEEILRIIPTPNVAIERLALLLSIFKTLDRRLSHPSQPLKKELGCIKKSAVNVRNKNEA